jgi:chaperonin GroES
MAAGTSSVGVLMCILLCCAVGVYGFRLGMGTSTLAAAKTRLQRRFHQPVYASAQTVVGKTMNLLHDNILVKLDTSKETSKGGILLSDSAKSKTREGQVVAAGPGQLHQETGNLWDMGVSEGANVAFGEYSGMEINFNGAPHQLISDNDVLYQYSGSSDDVGSFRCVHDFVLVKLDIEEEKSPSGVIVSSNSANNKKVGTGVVVNAGPGRKAVVTGKIVPVEVAVNDKVSFRDYAGTDVKVKGVRYTVVRASDIVAKL